MHLFWHAPSQGNLLFKHVLGVVFHLPLLPVHRQLLVPERFHILPLLLLLLLHLRHRVLVLIELVQLNLDFGPLEQILLSLPGLYTRTR